MQAKCPGPDPNHRPPEPLHGTVDERDAAGAVPRPAVLDQLALDGVRRVVRRQEAGPVGGGEGLDADGAGSVCRVQWGSASASGAMLCPRSRRLRAYDDAVTDHDTAKLTRGAALWRGGRRNAAAGGQAHAAPDAEPVRQGLRGQRLDAEQMVALSPPTANQRVRESEGRGGRAAGCRRPRSTTRAVALCAPSLIPAGRGQDSPARADFARYGAWYRELPRRRGT